MILKQLAIIMPCYNEEVIIHKSLNQLLNLLNRLIDTKKIASNSYISIIDDGSNDTSYNILCEIAKDNKQIKIIKLLYNSGHQNALLCGLTENRADIYITLDFDLQDDIEVIPEMIDKFNNNNVEIIYGVRKNRDSDPFFKGIFANIYYNLLSFIGTKHIKNCADFRLVSDSVAEFLREIKETNIYLRGLLFDCGFKYDTVFYDRKIRIGGHPKYNIRSSINLALNGITSSTYLPMRAMFCIGISLFLLSVILKSISALVLSINLIFIGIIGEYIGRTLTESKKRPNFIIKTKIN